jgi:hypothetical protein
MIEKEFFEICILLQTFQYVMHACIIAYNKIIQTEIFIQLPSLLKKHMHQGSMLWSQFSAIFVNFWRKKWRFSQKTNVMIKFLHNLSLFLV